MSLGSLTYLKKISFMYSLEDKLSICANYSPSCLRNFHILKVTHKAVIFLKVNFKTLLKNLEERSKPRPFFLYTKILCMYENHIFQLGEKGKIRPKTNTGQFSYSILWGIWCDDYPQRGLNQIWLQVRKDSFVNDEPCKTLLISTL